MDCGVGEGEGGGRFIREVLHFLRCVLPAELSLAILTKRCVYAVMYKEFSALFGFCLCLPKYNQ